MASLHEIMQVRLGYSKVENPGSPHSHHSSPSSNGRARDEINPRPGLLLSVLPMSCFSYYALLFRPPGTQRISIEVGYRAESCKTWHSFLICICHSLTAFPSYSKSSAKTCGSFPNNLHSAQTWLGKECHALRCHHRQIRFCCKYIESCIYPAPPACPCKTGGLIAILSEALVLSFGQFEIQESLAIGWYAVAEYV